MRHDNDRDTQYRSGIYCVAASQTEAVLASHDRYQQALSDAGRARISTEIIAAPTFYYAEDYHQQ